MTDYITMFAATFATVFCLGLQSKNVNQSRYVAAIITSFFISLGQFLFAKYAAVGDAVSFFVCAAGGCAGIAFSIWFYDTVLYRRRHGIAPLTRADVTIAQHLHQTGIPLPGETK